MSEELEKACADWLDRYWGGEQPSGAESLTAFVREQVEKALIDKLDEYNAIVSPRIVALEAACAEADKLEHLTLGGRYHWQAYQAARTRTKL